MRQCRLVVIASTLLLSGCSMPSATITSQDLPFLPVAVPIQPSERYEVGLNRINSLLQRMQLSRNESAQLFYERGLIYDRLGLRATAKIDFGRSLYFNPIQPEIYNTLGIYHTQEQKFDLAYEAFDSALELNEEHGLARRNRGIALYYAGRLHLAKRDLLKYYEDNINDPYRVIWLYLVEEAQIGEQQAQANLVTRYEESDQSDLGWEVARLYLNEITEQEYLREIQVNSLDNEQLAERLCEGYFYLGKRYQQFGKDGLAAASYKLALSSNAYDFIEHRYALLELNKIRYKKSSVNAGR